MWHCTKWKWCSGTLFWQACDSVVSYPDSDPPFPQCWCIASPALVVYMYTCIYIHGDAIQQATEAVSRNIYIVCANTYYANYDHHTRSCPYCLFCETVAYNTTFIKSYGSIRAILGDIQGCIPWLMTCVQQVIVTYHDHFHTAVSVTGGIPVEVDVIFSEGVVNWWWWC